MLARIGSVVPLAFCAALGAQGGAATMKLRPSLIVYVPDADAGEAAGLVLARKDRGNRPGRALLIGDGPGPGRRVEYRLVAPETVGELPDVEVLGMHYAKVRPDRIDAFDRFVAEKLHPAVGNLRPDLRLLYYKPIRGDEPGNYLTVFALTLLSRDTYWPKGQDSDALRAAFSPSVKALAGELRTYLVEGSYATGDLAAAVFESKEWADFVIAPR